MKKLVSVFAASILAACVLLCGCGDNNKANNKSENIFELTPFCVLTPSDDFEGRNLSEFMDFAKARGTFDYNIANDMVISINGIDNAADYSYCWMLYTDDAENSNDAWSKVKYLDRTYLSASLGATQLIIAKDCTYIWVYTKF